MNNKEFAALVSEFGNDIVRAVQSTNSNNIDDPELRDLCNRARPLLSHIISIVEANRPTEALQQHKDVYKCPSPFYGVRGSKTNEWPPAVWNLTKE
jgi:hypothetical protein